MSRNALLGVDTGVGCSEDKCNALLPMVNVKPIVYIALQEGGNRKPRQHFATQKANQTKLG